MTGGLYRSDIQIIRISCANEGEGARSREIDLYSWVHLNDDESVLTIAAVRAYVAAGPVGAAVPVGPTGPVGPATDEPRVVDKGGQTGPCGPSRAGSSPKKIGGGAQDSFGPHTRVVSVA
jgi:hypothetical protein